MNVSAGLPTPEGRFGNGEKDNRAQTDTAVIIPPIANPFKPVDHASGRSVPALQIALIREHDVGLTTCPDSRP